MNVLCCCGCVFLVRWDFVVRLCYDLFLFQRTSSSTGSLSRVKALQVLFAVSSDSVIEKISGTSSNEVR